MQFNASTFFCGARGRFQYTYDDEVIWQGGKVVARVGLAGEDVGQVGDIIAIDGRVDGYAVIVVLYSFYELPVI